MTPDSPAELRTWLERNGVDTSAWGSGGTKSVADLWRELENAECALTADPPERLVSFTQVNIEIGGRRLFEVAQKLVSGDVRPRDSPPSEKMIPGETPEQAAIRCLREELGVEACPDDVVPGSHKVPEKSSPSLSYPGLRTHYVMHEVSMRVDGLPNTEFTTTERSSTDHAVETHYWAWRETS
jgi:hypothetical protein